MLNSISETLFQRISQGNNVSLLFDDEENFSLMGLKFMQAHSKESFLRCTKVRYNGQLKLIYFVEHYQNLPTILASIQPNKINTVVFKLLSGILQIRQNGFLPYENIIISPEDIYLDAKTLEPKFIYVPLTINDSYERKMTFENELRRNLSNCIKKYSQVMVDNTTNLLCNNSFELEQILKELQKTVPVDGLHITNKKTAISLFCEEAGLKFNVNKSPFIVGRNKECDAVLDLSNAISRRVHCKFVFENQEWFVIDESKFGTYLNNKKCVPGQKHPVKDGDTIRIWELVFQVKFI